MDEISPPTSLPTGYRKRFLTSSQIVMVEEALSSLGEFGQVRLVVEKGHLRFIVIEKSYDALKWPYGSATLQQEE